LDGVQFFEAKAFRAEIFVVKIGCYHAVHEFGGAESFLGISAPVSLLLAPQVMV
jgi:hypothetical protein